MNQQISLFSNVPGISWNIFNFGARDSRPLQEELVYFSVEDEQDPDFMTPGPFSYLLQTRSCSPVTYLSEVS